MQPATIRTVGTFAIAFGVLSLLAFFALVALVGIETPQAPQSLLVVVVPVQVATNIGIGWMLRRQARQMTG